jgi:hypothetical protein
MKGEKMNTPNMINPNPQPMANTGFSQPQFRNLPIILVNSMEDVKAYQMGPGSSVLFMNYGMTDFLMRTTDPNGFPLPDRTWTMTETTPKPVQPSGDYVTKSEFKDLSDKIDKLLKQLS